MPEISRFLGIIIAMYYNDHAPLRVLGLVQEWREYHKAELSEDWNLARERKALKRIEPLE